MRLGPGLAAFFGLGVCIFLSIPVDSFALGPKRSASFKQRKAMSGGQSGSVLPLRSGDSPSDSWEEFRITILVSSPRKVILASKHRGHIRVTLGKPPPKEDLPRGDLMIPVDLVVSPELDRNKPSWRIIDFWVVDKMIVSTRLRTKSDGRLIRAIRTGKRLYFASSGGCLPAGSVSCGTGGCHVSKKCIYHDSPGFLAHRE